MRNIARAVAILGVLALAVATVPAVSAQGGGGQDESGMIRQQGQSGQRGQRGQQGQQGQRGQGSQNGQGLSDQQRQRIRADRQQVGQLQNCTGTAAGIQSKARKMAQSGKKGQGQGQGQAGGQGQGQGQAGGRGQGQGQAGGQGQGFNPTRAQAESSQIGEQVQKMMREHDQFMQGLSGEQQSLLRDQARDLGRTRDRIQDCVDGLNQAVGAASPDPQRVSERAGELAQEMETWQRQYQRLAEDMGVRSGREGS